MSRTNKNPKVSVLTPIYNTDPLHLKEAIESILNQTYKDFEFIILNDSPDNTKIEKIVLDYKKKDKRIKYFKNEKNLGITPSRNKLIDLASGEYLAIFDHDDISLPNRLKLEVEYLDSHLSVGVVSGQVHNFIKNRITKHPENNMDIKIALMKHNIVSHTAMMLRKSVLDKYSIRYEENYSPAEDYMLVLRLVKYTMFYNIPKVLLKYRNFDGNTSHIQKEKMFNASELCSNFIMKEYPYLYAKLKTYFFKRIFIKMKIKRKLKKQKDF